MFIQKPYSNNIEENQIQLIEQLHEFANENNDAISIYSNCANHLKQYFNEDVNWVGFYLVKDNNLILGPFNGLPAVTNIDFGKGVCGTCLQNKKTIVIDDVCAHSNHIVCDINSRSEICIPIFNKEKEMIALLDMDSPKLAMFSKYQHLLQEYICEMEKFF